MDEELYYRENANIRRKYKAKGKMLERIKGLAEIRNITRDIINIQLKGCTKDELKLKQNGLNKTYDESIGIFNQRQIVRHLVMTMNIHFYVL